MTERIVGDIFFNEKIVGAVSDDAPLIGLSDRVLSYHRARSITTKVKMDGLSTQQALLPKISEIYTN